MSRKKRQPKAALNSEIKEPSGDSGSGGNWKIPLGVIVLLMFGVVGTLVWVATSRRSAAPVPLQFTRLGGGSQQPDHWSHPETCGKCHVAEFEQWKASNHANANRLVSVEKDGEAFKGHFELADDSERFEFLRDGEKFTLSVSGPVIGDRKFPVEGVIAVEPLRQYLLATGNGRYQTTAIAWDVNKKEWFDVFPNDPREPEAWGHWLGQGMNWNSNCATCHMTEFKKNYDVPTHGYRSTWRFHGISCVQCHAGSADHARRATAGDTKAPGLRLTPAQNLDNCASCHSRREQLTADEFRAGERFHDHHTLALPDQPGVYHPDGQILDEDFEFGSFMMSRMGGKAGVVCMDCHNPHTLATRLPVKDNQLCMSCHGTGMKDAPKIDPVAHSRHAAGSEGNQCVACHMPTTVYMARDPRHDHGFLSPDPRLTKETGVPNACNRCHQDKSTDWAIEAAEKWFGPNMNERTRERARIMHRAQRGDPAMLSEHLALLAREEVPAWRATLVGMLAPFLNEQRVFNAGLGALRDPDPMVRQRAARLLSDHPGATEAISALQKDPFRTVRLEAHFAGRSALKAESEQMRELRAYLDANADRPSGTLKSAELALAQNQPDLAAQHVQQAVRLDPRSAAAMRDGAIVLARANKPGEAMEMLEQAVRVEPGFAEAHYSLGLLRAERGDLEGAVESLRNAARLDPSNARASYNLALALTKLERWAEALPAIQAAESGGMAASPDLRYTKAIILARLGRRAEAEAILRTLER